MIKQTTKNEKLSVRNALSHIGSIFPPLFSMKFVFWIKAVLWGLVPIYGIIQGSKYVVYSVMASNVLVFEGLSGTEGRDRCRELYEADPDRLGTRTFITIPALALTLFIILFTVSVEIFDSSIPFWLWIIISTWIVLPISGALNTLYYLRFREFTDSPVMASENQ